MQEVVLGGGIEYAVEMMTRYRNEALEMLEQMPDRPARESLRQLIDFTIQRKS